jgi:hopanoid biosynthesis associated RND transporter like protein HpnN
VAERAAASLAAALRERADLFLAVRRPDAGPFFGRHGLLYLPLPELRQTTERMVEAQPLLGTLAADPSSRGILAALALMLQGVERGDVALAGLAQPLDVLARTAEAAAARRAEPLDWTALLLDRTPSPRELRRFVLVRPRLDYAALSPGAAAARAIRAEAARLGLTEAGGGVRVRLTGSVAVADEEFATISEGAALSTGLTVALEAVLLWMALRSLRLILPVLGTVLTGLLLTGAFGLLVFHEFNVISVAFAVLFIGLGDDQSVQFAIRYREARHRRGGLTSALVAAGRDAGPSMGLAALAIAAGFFALGPTEYRGMAELGIIAGAGMLLAWLLSLTMLPALLRLARPPGEPEPVGYRFLAPVDRFLRAKARTVTAGAAMLALLCIAALPGLRFDFNPMNLRNPRTEAVAAIRDLMHDPVTSPYALNVLAPDLPSAAALAARLEALPEVAHALTLQGLVPGDQPAKLELIADAAMLLEPSLAPPQVAAPPADAELVRTLTSTAMALGRAAQRGSSGATDRLAAALAALAQGSPEQRAAFEGAITPGLRTTLRQLSEALRAGAVTLAGLPAELTRDWIAPDGRARVEVAPRDTTGENAALRRFAAAVQSVAPGASGAPVSILAASRTILRSFLEAGAIALVLVVGLLAAALRDARLVALGLAPLILAGLLTLAASALLGPPLNLANIIALPLLFGMGAAFDVYYVMAWRAGERDLLSTAMTRGMLFSTLTTLAAFGTLALSAHPGTASMGVLLVLSLVSILVAVLFALPAMLHTLAPAR